MLGRHDVGHRVVVRRVVGVRDNRPVLSDLLGELVRLDDTSLTIRTAAGLVNVSWDAVRQAKRIPDRRRRSATERLEMVAALGWPAPDTEHLGDWWLRAAEGWTHRANSALAVGDPGLPLPAAVDAVESWYRSRGLPPTIAVPLPLGARLTAELDRRGWATSPPVEVRTAPLRPIATPGAGQVRLDTEPPEQWLAVVAARKQGLPAAARHVLTAVAQVRFAGVYSPGGAPLAIARGVVTGDWLGISLVEVDPEHRRRGLARRVTGALAGWAVEVGATRAYLQVEAHNSAAIAFYAGMGFTEHHRYVNRTLA